MGPSGLMAHLNMAKCSSRTQVRQDRDSNQHSVDQKQHILKEKPPLTFFCLNIDFNLSVQFVSIISISAVAQRLNTGSDSS